MKRMLRGYLQALASKMTEELEALETPAWVPRATVSATIWPAGLTILVGGKAQKTL